MFSKKDYRKVLEQAARQMILVHRIDTLNKLILRAIIRNIKVNHAGIFLLDKIKNEYVVEVSKGKEGDKIPPGFTKIKPSSAIIRYFSDPKNSIFDQKALRYNRLNYYLRKYKDRKDLSIITNFLKTLKDEMSLFRAKLCIPGIFRDKLIGVLFLGNKKDNSDFTSEEIGFLTVLASDVVMAIQNAWLFEDLNKQLEKNKKLFVKAVSALSAAIEAKDKYTMGHTERVVNIALTIARNLSNIQIENWNIFKESLSIAALLHDIGKISIPEKILNKKKPLNEKEWQFILRHPVVGFEILSSLEEYQDVLLGVKYHHERYDGKGYPSALKGENIPLIACIISVADSYDAMTSERPYRKALTPQDALIEIKKNRGKQFHPLIVDAFEKAYQQNFMSFNYYENPKSR